MKQLVICLLALFVLSHAQEPRAQEEERIQCKRDLICDVVCEHGQKTDDKGCPTCTCNDAPESEVACAMPMCATHCPNGYRNDARGCMTCECAASVCENHECAMPGSVCKEVDVMCVRAPCQKQPKCAPKPLCHHKREQHQGLLGGDGHDQKPHGRPGPMDHVLGGIHKRFVRAVRDLVAYKPECDEEGHFVPQQCHKVRGECWCVDDRGIELDGSRKKVQTAEERQNHHCAKNQTKAVHGQFQMKHDLDQVDQHLGNLKTATKKSLSQWLMVEDQYIVQVEITPSGREVDILEVEFMAVIDENGNIDLASSVYTFYQMVEKNQCSLEYGDHHLTVPPQSLKVQHKYQPALPRHPITEENTDGYTGCFRRFYRHHQAAALAGIIGMIFFLVILAVLVRQIVKKRREGRTFSPMKNFRENLAFTNQLYGKLGNEEKKSIPENEVKPAQTEA